jgi:hypothetical protein
MPNQRKPGREVVTVWLPTEEKKTFEAVAKAQGLFTTELLTICAREEIFRAQGKPLPARRQPKRTAKINGHPLPVPVAG